MTSPRLVMLRPLGLGDLLTAVPAMRAIARAFPEHQRLLATTPTVGPLALLSGAVDRVVPVEPLRLLPPDCDALDLAIDLHGRGPESHRVLLATHPRRLIAFANAAVPRTAGFPRWRDDEHEVHRWCRLLQESGIPADPSDLDLDPPAVEAPAMARDAIVIHPGAAFPARRWPVERWAIVARALGPALLITGGAAERELAMRVADGAGISDERVVAGATDVLQLAAIVAKARLVVCADTGIAHLATALRTPSVVLFGPTSPAHWGPPAGRSWHRVIWKGRRGDPNAQQPDPGLLAIGVDEVLAAVASLSDVGHAIRA